MDSFKFRPKLNDLEDRLTPAITPFEVFQALEQTRDAQQQISDILKYFSGPVNVHAQSYFATVLPSLVDESVRSAVVLNEFHSALADQIEANPDASFFARELIGGAGANLSHAYSNMTQAETTGVGLGAPSFAVRHPAPVPPVVPPVTPPTPPEPPPVPRDESGMSDTMPSLTDASWASVGTSGLRVWDSTEGTGAIVEAGQDLVLHFTGWIRSTGQVFESTRTSLSPTTVSGEPAERNLDEQIEGWKQGIPGMRAGGVRRLDIPAALAFGATGRLPSVPANADVVYEIKIFESSNPDQEPPPITRDESGMTSTIPSLTDPSWSNIGELGLRSWDVTEGTGPVVEVGQDIVLHYTGWLRDGTVFDSSRASLSPRGGTGEPAEFSLSDLIVGWQQGIPGMRAGGIRRLDIPASLAYGAPGSPPSIPPNSDLVFEIKIFESSDPA